MLDPAEHAQSFVVGLDLQIVEMGRIGVYTCCRPSYWIAVLRLRGECGSFRKR